MSAEVLEIAPHPAPFNRDALKVIRQWVEKDHALGRPKILDPFAGIGRVHEFRPKMETYGIEIEPEWAAASEFTLCGDMFDVKAMMSDEGSLLPEYFNVIVTSPVFGNRMSDHHEAKDDSRRITYRHKLGRPLHENNSGRLNWGKKYRDFHERAWTTLSEDVRGVSDFILDIKDHIRGGQRQYVSEWHVQTLRDLGWRLIETEFIQTDGMKDGANNNLRVGGELVAWFRRSERPW